MRRPAMARTLFALCLLAFVPSVLRAQPAPPPKLVVILVVDQMRGDYVDRYAREWSKGLHRLLAEGAWFRRAAYPYLNTLTCVGHATVSTGTFPSTHGLVGNSWYDRASGRSVGCVEDATVAGVGYAQPVKSGGSPARLLVPALADEMRAQLPGPTRVVTFSMKDRASIMLAGHKGDVVTWFSAAARGFASSSAYASQPVPFLVEYFKAHPIEADFAQPWTRLLPEDRYLFTDQGVGEKPAKYWTSTFPHPIAIGDRTGPESYDAWETSPFSDAYLGGLGEAAVDALGLGQGPGTDLLGISFSALDLTGHDFGPSSHEVQDVLARLDVTIGRLLEHLDRKVGAANYVVALTADHGAAPIPEQMRALGMDAGRVGTAAITKAATDALQEVLGPGTYNIRLANSDLYLDPAVTAYLREDPVALETVLRALRDVPGVANAYLGEQLDAHAAAGDVDAKAALASYFAGRSGDIIAVAKPYWFYVRDDGSPQPGSATTHGSLYLYDRHVPLLLFGGGIRPGEYLRDATPADVAPTLAFLCGVTLPRPDGHVLTDALTAGTPAAARVPRR